MFRRAIHITYKLARRIAVTVVGSTVLAVGVALIVLPGPAVVVIPIGLAILSLEFAWARMWLRKVRESISSQSAEARAGRAESRRQQASRR
jgi:uncharacterized protein (TIGR02611 family)